MIHSALHWPQVADSSLWPSCVAQAVFLWNHIPDPSTGLSPSDLFSRSRYPIEKFHDLHVWGCPAYVLDKTLADGKKIPRWKPRSSRGMYLGRADKYASTVPLILNLQTGSITPQFHVVLDDWFATVSSSPDDLPDFNSPEWISMFGDSIFQYILDDEDVTAMRELSNALEDSIDSVNADNARRRVLEALHHHPQAVTPPPPIPPAPTTVDLGRENTHQVVPIMSSSPLVTAANSNVNSCSLVDPIPVDAPPAAPVSAPPAQDLNTSGIPTAAPTDYTLESAIVDTSSITDLPAASPADMSPPVRRSLRSIRAPRRAIGRSPYIREVILCAAQPLS